MALILAIFSSKEPDFLAANPPIDTWSYCPAEVTMESTDAGLTRTLLSDSSAAVVSIFWRNYTGQS